MLFTRFRACTYNWETPNKAIFLQIRGLVYVFNANAPQIKRGSAASVRNNKAKAKDTNVLLLDISKVVFKMFSLNPVKPVVFSFLFLKLPTSLQLLAYVGGHLTCLERCQQHRFTSWLLLDMLVSRDLFLPFVVPFDTKDCARMLRSSDSAADATSAVLLAFLLWSCDMMEFKPPSLLHRKVAFAAPNILEMNHRESQRTVNENRSWETGFFETKKISG